MTKREEWKALCETAEEWRMQSKIGPTALVCESDEMVKALVVALREACEEPRLDVAASTLPPDSTSEYKRGFGDGLFIGYNRGLKHEKHRTQQPPAEKRSIGYEDVVKLTHAVATVKEYPPTPEMPVIIRNADYDWHKAQQPRVNCPTCEGRGTWWRDTTAPVTCPACHGAKSFPVVAEQPPAPSPDEALPTSELLLRIAAAIENGIVASQERNAGVLAIRKEVRKALGLLPDTRPMGPFPSPPEIPPAASLDEAPPSRAQVFETLHLFVVVMNQMHPDLDAETVVAGMRERLGMAPAREGQGGPVKPRTCTIDGVTWTLGEDGVWRSASGAVRRYTNGWLLTPTLPPSGWQPGLFDTLLAAMRAAAKERK